MFEMHLDWQKVRRLYRPATSTNQVKFSTVHGRFESTQPVHSISAHIRGYW